MINKALDIIKETSILSTDDLSTLSLMQKELLQSWETVQVFRTETEMKYSVLKSIKFPTPDAKYWQAVREQNAMFSELVNLSYNYRKTVVEIKILKRKIKKEEDDLEKELLQIDIERACYSCLQMEKTAHERIRELKLWSKIKNALCPLLKYGDKNVDAHQFEAMKIRFNREAELLTAHTGISERINILGKAEEVNK